VNNGQVTVVSAVAASFSAYNDGSGASNVTAMGDGSDGSTTTKSVETAVSTQTTNWTLTYTLNTSSNPSGYSLSEIDTVSGWTADYANQKYALAYSTVSAPTNFVSLGVFENDSNITTGNPAVSLKTALTNSGGGNFVTNVAELQFTFEPDSIRGHQGAYREIDVIGSPTPEPASLGVLGMAGLGLLFRRRRAGCRSGSVAPKVLNALGCS
jgi:hypothetical protein